MQLVYRMLVDKEFAIDIVRFCIDIVLNCPNQTSDICFMLSQNIVILLIQYQRK